MDGRFLLPACAAALAACAPGGGPSTSSTGMATAEAACRSQAEAQLLHVRAVRSSVHVPGSGGRIIGANVILAVSRHGAEYDVRCSYTFETGRAVISPL